MIQTTNNAPDFTIPGVIPGEEPIQQFTLSEAVTDGPVILVFYPFDFSPVCTEQLCTFRDMEWLTFTEDIEVWGISIDSAHSHHEFISKYDLGFPLLTDRLGDVADQYDVLLDEFEHHERVPSRSIVSVDSDRTVRHVWKAENQYTSPKIEEVEATLSWYDDDEAR